MRVGGATTKTSFASKVFGHDIFVSFALGPAPRGTHSYASDLARQLRERDFTVYFSEDEAAPGAPLNRTLRTALLRSRTLVVIANRATLEDPRWVRREVEEFRANRGRRPIIIINVGGALQDARLAQATQAWLDHQDRIWIDESEEALLRGIVSESVVARLVTTPRHARANTRWRALIVAVALTLLTLTGVASRAAWIATRNAAETLRESRLVEEESRRVRGVNLLSASQAEGDPGRASLLLAEFAGADMVVPAEALAWAVELSQQTVPAAVLRHDANVVSAVFDPSGSRVLTAAGSTVFLWSRDGRGDPRKLQGHEHTVNSAEFDPSGNRIVSASDDWTARIWSSEPRTTVILRGHNGPVVSAHFSADGARVLTASLDGTARLWNSRDGREVVTLVGHGSGVLSAFFSADGKRIVTASSDGTVRVWNANGTALETFRDIGGPVSARFDSDGRRVVAASRDGTAHVLALERQDASITLSGHAGALWDAQFSNDGSRVLTSSWDGTARIWSANGKGAPLVLRGHSAAVRTASFDRSDAHVITASADGTAFIWQSDGSGSPMLLKGHTAPLWNACFSADGRWALTASDDGTVRVWATTNGSQPTVLQDKGSRVRDAQFSPDGTLVVTASDDAAARIWRVDGVGKPVLLSGLGRPIFSASFSHDGLRIVTGGADGSARVWSTDGKKEFELPRATRSIGAEFLKDDRRILLGTIAGPAGLWDAPSGLAPVTLDGENPYGSILSSSSSSVGGAVSSADGRYVALATVEGDAYAWPSGSSQNRMKLPGARDPVTRIALSPNGDRIVSGHISGTLWLWPIGKQAMLPTELHGHTGAITDARFSGNGEQLLTASADGTTRLWPLRDAAPPVILGRQDAVVLSARFSNDGRHIVTATSDGVIRVWSNETKSTFIELRRHRSRALAEFSPDGARVLSASQDGEVRLQLIEWQHLLDYLRARTTDCLPSSLLTQRLGATPLHAQAESAACARRFDRTSSTP